MVALARSAGVKSSTKLTVASSLMAVGMLPMLLWLAMLVAAIDHLRTGEFGLPELMFAGVAGMTAYLVTLVVAGAGAIWAAVQLRGASRGGRLVAKSLIAITAVILLMPWALVLTLVVARMLD
jgi:hypothetical protein